MTLKTSTGFLCVRTNAAGKRVWTVLCRSMPLCHDNERLHEVLEVAQRAFGRATLCVWDGDQGEFVSEMVADPNW